MYQKEFDSLLKSAIPKAVLLWGECEFFIDLYGAKVRKLVESQGECDVFPIYFDEYDYATIVSILSQQSLFAGASIVILKLNKIKATMQKDIAKFLQILKRNPNNCLIIEFYSDNSVEYGKAGKALSALFNSKEFAAVRFFNPNSAREVLEILRSFANKHSLKISDYALNHLYEIQNKNIGICANELAKFAVFDDEITIEKINALSYGLYTNSVDELCEAILNRGDYLKIIAKIEEEGFTDADLVRALQGYFYRLFLFFAYIRVNGRVDSKEILKYKLPPQIEKKYADFAVKLREMQYLQIFALLNEWRANVIWGRDKNFFANLIKLQAIIH